MTGFSEERIDIGFDYGTQGGPEYSTNIVIASSGWEFSNASWAEARGQWQLGERNILGTEKDYLLSFFRARKGRFQPFRFKDWSDFEATEQVIGVGDGAVRDFQLQKNYSSGAEIENRLIKKPVAGTVTVKVDGIVTMLYTMDLSTGIITMNAPPSSGEVITASCEFDVPVRFDTDKFNATFEFYEQGTNRSVFRLGSLPLVEVRV